MERVKRTNEKSAIYLFIILPRIKLKAGLLSISKKIRIGLF